MEFEKVAQPYLETYSIYCEVFYEHEELLWRNKFEKSLNVVIFNKIPFNEV